MALEPPSNSSIGEVSGVEDIVDLLKDDDLAPGKDKTAPLGEKEEKDETDEEKLETEDDDESETGEEEDDEDEDEETDDEEGLRLDKSSFPRKKEILKAFPDLFKKFPSIEASIYRDRQFSEVFPNPEDAVDAQAKAEQLDAFSNDIFRGDLQTLFRTVASNDKGAFYRMVDGFLDNVGAVDPQAHQHVISNIVKFTIMAMAEEAKANNDQELMDNATALHKFVFKSSKWEPPTALSKRSDQNQDQELQRERADRVREKFTEANESLQRRVDNTILATINTYIDPKKEMSSYIKKHATQDAFGKLERALQSDRSLRSTLDRLWKASAEERFSSSSLDKIRAAYLSKAKTLLRDVIKSARIEALGHSRKRASSNGQERDRKGHIAVGRPSGSSGGSKKLEIPKGMSNRDFLMSD